ncbi:leucyl aminopeptidase family protein [Arsenicitalea aurantiaca]|uniref:Leucyl aminopeptidase family protein n=1 Tax=Arsenicitalea aurantiaca TaxID=1783274 RepID=A0A433X2J0_9HYPH|nr:leucyl aminopeptidase family protein [Arsenicitalea aurantiaca]RUT28202.1 leucyl aminopeptidase family protein [Arsenicitalea aurantiaca]
MSIATASIPLICVPDGPDALAALPERARRWAEANGFAGQRGRLLPIPDAEGGREGVLFGMGGEGDRPGLVLGLAAAALEPGRYRLEGAFGAPDLAALGFRLGAYRFERYRPARGVVLLDTPEGADEAEVERLVDAAVLARDLINTPANDLGPEAFEREIRAFAGRHGMDVRAIVGDELLAQNFPMIHAVGRAAAEAPRLLDLSWGREGDPRVTLVGKGVTFDTGGLDIKPAASMLLMKKDMGGAANVLGLAHAVMAAGLRVRLRVLIPIVENAISASSFRPGDVLRSRAGISVEIGNTDAEGRLILADALALADEESPELLIDMATLTGAARVALGPELPPLYTDDDGLAEAIMAAGAVSDDPVWRLPLWAPYAQMLSSRIADINHVSSGGFAGSITAALFLKRFVRQAGSWAHLDIFAWAPEARAGRPQGGTDQAIRALYFMLKARFPA